MTSHYLQSLVVAPSEVSPKRETGISTPSRAGRVQTPAPIPDGDYFDVPFDPTRNYLRELKNARDKGMARGGGADRRVGVSGE